MSLKYEIESIEAQTKMITQATKEIESMAWSDNKKSELDHLPFDIATDTVKVGELPTFGDTNPDSPHDHACDCCHAAYANYSIEDTAFIEHSWWYINVFYFLCYECRRDYLTSHEFLKARFVEGCLHGGW